MGSSKRSTSFVNQSIRRLGFADAVVIVVLIVASFSDVGRVVSAGFSGLVTDCIGAGALGRR
jgi:hypothetical protein